MYKPHLFAQNCHIKFGIWHCGLPARTSGILISRTQSPDEMPSYNVSCEKWKTTKTDRNEKYWIKNTRAGSNICQSLIFRLSELKLQCTGKSFSILFSMSVSWNAGWCTFSFQETLRNNACTWKTSFSRLHFWFILISFKFFFPKFELPNLGCGLSGSVAYMYTLVFTVILIKWIIKFVKRKLNKNYMELQFSCIYMYSISVSYR